MGGKKERKKETDPEYAYRKANGKTRGRRRPVNKETTTLPLGASIPQRNRIPGPPDLPFDHGDRAEDAAQERTAR